MLNDTYQRRELRASHGLNSVMPIRAKNAEMYEIVMADRQEEP